MAWLTDIMEILFTGAMLSLAADLGKKYYGKYRPYVVGGVAIFSLSASLVVFLLNYSQALQGTILLQPIQSIFSTLYSLDNLGVLVILTILVVGLAIGFYCMMSFSATVKAGPFFTMLVLLVTSAVGIISSGDFLTLFLFWTGLSVTAFGLVSFQRRDVSLEAALKYFFIAGIGSLVYLYGVALVYSLEGSIRFSSITLLLQQNSTAAIYAVALLLVGLGVEVAVFPFHTWLPDAYGSAPAPIGASSVVSETLVFAILKILQPLVPTGVSSPLIHGIQLTLVGFAVLTMFVGNFGAMGQGNMRRMLAFSSISQIGYILAGIATLTPLGFIAATFQIWNHGLLKSNFFMLTGFGKENYEEADFNRMKGIGRQNKFLGVLYTASSLAMVGSPPFGMFWSELLIVQSLIAVGSSLFFGAAVIVVLNVFLSIAYYLRIINNMVLSPSGDGQPASETTVSHPKSMVVPVLLLTLSIITGLVPAIFLHIIS
jgi:proton-translocating NADH-quinone oxidoreductase chain N